jgi:hypothetical protein
MLGSRMLNRMLVVLKSLWDSKAPKRNATAKISKSKNAHSKRGRTNI